MATSRSAKQFSLRMSVQAEALGREVERVVRKVALRIDQVAVTTTPVDTGRAANNWFLTIGKPTVRADRSADPSASEALMEAGTEAKKFKSGKGVLGSIFIANNVEYIVPLDGGHGKPPHSQKAPQGMSRPALAEGIAQLKRERIKLKD